MPRHAERYLATVLSSVAAAAGMGGCLESDEESAFKKTCQPALTINTKERLNKDGFSSDIADTERAQERFEEGCEDLWEVYDLSQDNGPLDLENPIFSDESYFPEEKTRDFLEDPYRRALQDIVEQRAGASPNENIELNNRRALIIGAESDVEALEDIAEDYDD